MATIGSLAARILADASGVKTGVAATRAQMRIARQAFVDSRTDVEKYGLALEKLNAAREAGAFRSEDDYARALQAVREQLDPVIREERALAQAREQTMERGRQVAESLRTAEEQRTERLAELRSLLDAAAISQETYNRAAAQVTSERWIELGGRVRTTGLAIAAVGAAATATFGAMGGSAIAAAAEYEQSQVAFATLLGSAEAAQDTLARLAGFAARTPFDLPEVLQAGRALATFGERGDQLEQTLAILGNAASATGTRFSDLSGIYNQVRGAGNLLTQDFRQLSTRGVISLDDIARHFGVVRTEAQALISAGRVGFDDLRAILERLSAEGGRFEDMMGKQAETLRGSLATLRGELSQLATGVGQELLPSAKTLVGAVRGVTSGLAELDGTTKAALAGTVALGTGVAGVVVASGTAIAVTGQLITWYGRLQASATGARVAQVALNTSIKAGYVGAATAAFAAGYTLTKLLLDQTEAAKKAKAAYAEYADGIDALAAREAQERRDTLSQIEGLAGGDRQSRITSELEMARRQLDGLTARAEMAKAEADRLRPTWVSLGQAGRAVWQAQTAEYESLRQRAADAGRWINTLEDALRGAADAPAPKLDVAGTAGAGAAIQTLAQQRDALIDTLQQQAREVGLPADQVAVLRLQAQGLGDDWAHVITVMQRELGVRQRAAEATAEARRLAEALAEQQWAAGLAAQGWSDAQIQLERLARGGASREAIQQLAALQQQAAAMDAQATARQRAAQQQQTLHDALRQTTQRLREQAETAGMTADQIELYRLRSLGATAAQLGQVAALQAHARRLTDVRANADAAGASVARLSAGGDWTAVTRGSAEALDRIAAYRRLFAGLVAEARARPALAAPSIAPQVAATVDAASDRDDGNDTASRQTELLAAAVRLLDRIARATEADRIEVREIS